jgi:hypothetical protein
MVSEPQPLDLPPWADSEALLGFVDELHRAGFNLGIAQYTAAQDLLLTLVAHGDKLEPAERFRDLLGPLLCSSPREQNEFRDRFARWVARSGHSIVIEPWVWGPQQETRKTRVTRLGRVGQVLLRLLQVVVIGSVAGVLLSLAVALAHQLWHQGIPTGSDPAWFLLAFGIAVLTVLLPTVALVMRLWRRRPDLFLVRRQAEDAAVTVTTLAARDLSHKLFRSVSFFRIAQDLRRRSEVPSPEIDVAATVAATVRHGGWLTPVHEIRQVLPEYLVLIDRTGFSDQQARLVDELVDRLAEQGLFLTRFFFKGDPRICFPRDTGGTPLPLSDLAAHYPFHRLVLFTDGATLFSPRTGELLPWADRFAAWERRALLTPEQPEQWGHRERELGRLFTVLPATFDGLAALARRGQEGKSLPPPAHRPSIPFPRELRDHPWRWLERIPPAGEMIDSLFGELRRYLGGPGFLWLAACAVYPALDWGLTLYLGDGLDMDGEPLLDPGRLAALVRTPWFRHGFLPDWLRERLIATLSPDQERSIRTALHELLRGGRDEPADTFELEIAQRRSISLAALGRRLLSRRAGEPGADSPLRDRVLLAFLTGREPEPLAVRLPRELRGLFARRGARTLTLKGTGWRRKTAETAEPIEERPGNPWQNRHQVGLARGFFQTAWLFLARPWAGFKLTRRRDLRSALIFGAICSLGIGIIGLSIWLAAIHLSMILTRSLKRSNAGFQGNVSVVCYAAVLQLLWPVSILLLSIPDLGFIGCFIYLIFTLGQLLGLLFLTFWGLTRLQGLSSARAAAVLFVSLAPLWLVIATYLLLLLPS